MIFWTRGEVATPKCSTHGGARAAALSSRRLFPSLFTFSQALRAAGKVLSLGTRAPPITPRRFAGCRGGGVATPAGAWSEAPPPPASPPLTDTSRESSRRRRRRHFTGARTRAREAERARAPSPWGAACPERSSSGSIRTSRTPTGAGRSWVRTGAPLCARGRVRAPLGGPRRARCEHGLPGPFQPLHGSARPRRRRGGGGGGGGTRAGRAPGGPKARGMGAFAAPRAAGPSVVRCRRPPPGLCVEGSPGGAT